MAKYLFIYHGGKHPSTPADVKKTADAWGKWFGSMGAAMSPVPPADDGEHDGQHADERGAAPRHPTTGRR